MMQVAETLKLKLNTDDMTDQAFSDVTEQYRLACNYVSEYIFTHDFNINSVDLSSALYHDIRSLFGLKSQMVQSAIRTTTARYQTIDTQMQKKPYKFKADGKWYKIQRDMTWIQKSILFARPQADFVRNRDYSFVDEGKRISINTLGNRVKCTFVLPDYMDHKFLNEGWKFGTAKLVQLNGNWYFHISATKEVPEFDREDVTKVIGIDRGLRFVETIYDGTDTQFVSGKQIMDKRNKFDTVRAQLQSKGTKSAKRRLRAISGRENRWMSDVNHQLSKALVHKYGSGALFVLEDLEGVSTDERDFKSKKQTHDLRNWAFYDLEKKLEYKANETGGHILKVDAAYTSQRCPKCGHIHKGSRNHDTHTYTCVKCGYSSNDDRIGAMNIWLLGTLWVSGIDDPSFQSKKEKKTSQKKSKQKK